MGHASLITLVLALVVSTAGDEVALVALVLRLSAHTRNGLGVSLLLVAGLLPGVFLARRVGRRIDGGDAGRLLLAGLSVQAAVVAVMVPFGGSVVTVALSLALGCAGALSQACVLVIVGSVGDKTGHLRANAVLEVGRNAGYVVGPAGAGLLVAAGGTRLALTMDVASFVVAALAAVALPSMRSADVDDADAKDGGAESGLAYLWGNQRLRRLLGAAAVSVAASSVLNVALVFLVTKTLRDGPGAYGGLVSAISAGLLAGPLVFGRLLKDRDPDRVTLLAITVLGAALCATGLVSDVPAIAALLFVLGVANAIQNVCLRTAVLGAAPQRFRGQIASGYIAVLQSSVVVGFVAGSVSANHSQAALVTGGAVSVSAGLLGLAISPSRSKIEPEGATP